MELARQAMLTSAGIFTTVHIAATAVISGGLALIAALIINGRQGPALLESVLVGLLTAAAVFLWRKSANTPALNDDGINGFSPNDWLAPTLTLVFLVLYASLRTRDSRRFGQTLAAATITAFAVNVITI
jgi:hypothetical protein